VERLLLERALDHGARLVEGVTVTDLTQDDDGVRLSGVDQDGGTTVTDRACGTRSASTSRASR
ncbi:MAG TPA: hypothetical protein VK045_15155, partial [Ornithinicoccus sp.]|nr:hypothetical protein [Ornithinicoccus sp.]